MTIEEAVRRFVGSGKPITAERLEKLDGFCRRFKLAPSDVYAACPLEVRKQIDDVRIQRLNESLPNDEPADEPAV